MKIEMMQPLIVIAGPTAVGKTEFAIWLSGQLNAEIISADSMQVYKYMDIGTAKPSPLEQRLVKHYLIDVVEPDQEFSVADYKSLFDQTVRMIQSAGKLPIMVGGSGLYIRACTQSFFFEDPGGADWELRNSLKAQAQEHGVQCLYQQLEKVDAIAASRIHPNDLRRIIRALEVYQSTGIPISRLQAERNPDSQYQTIYIFIDRDRSELYQRIEARVDLMIEQNLIGEVESLLKRGYSPDLKPMQSLGYKQINEYFQRIYPLEEAVNRIKQLTRNYAKRQLTWFRKEPVDFWVNISSNKQEFFGVILNYIRGRLK
jgi:tRNA dimethylallyltransferase